MPMNDKHLGDGAKMVTSANAGGISTGTGFSQGGTISSKPTVPTGDIKIPQKINHVTVRWFDAYLEEFDATEVRFGSDLLWMRLANGENRHIPLRQVRWWSMSQESHARS